MVCCGNSSHPLCEESPYFMFFFINCVFIILLCLCDLQCKKNEMFKHFPHSDANPWTLNVCRCVSLQNSSSINSIYAVKLWIGCREVSSLYNWTNFSLNEQIAAFPHSLVISVECVCVCVSNYLHLFFNCESSVCYKPLIHAHRTV